MKSPVIVKSVIGTAAITFANPTQDPAGKCSCTVSLTGRYSGTGCLNFHPGEDCLVTFVRSAVYNPPIYTTDRHLNNNGSEVHFILGKTAEKGHIGLTI